MLRFFAGCGVVLVVVSTSKLRGIQCLTGPWMPIPIGLQAPSKKVFGVGLDLGPYRVYGYGMLFRYHALPAPTTSRREASASRGV